MIFGLRPRQRRRIWFSLRATLTLHIFQGLFSRIGHNRLPPRTLSTRRPSRYCTFTVSHLPDLRRSGVAMAAGNGPYLVIRLDDGFGEVFPLEPGQRFTLGRANTNRVVLKDELCSREHAEVYFAEGRWRLRDLKSLNGTRLNGEPLDSEWELGPGDEFQVGRTQFLYVDKLEELPGAPGA